MKSLKDLTPPSMTPHKERVEFLKSEGFDWGYNNSRCFRWKDEPGYHYEDRCFRKYLRYVDGMICTVYVFAKGIGVDMDYDCGGNSSTRFWGFDDYSFEEAYDLMVDYIAREKYLGS